MDLELNMIRVIKNWIFKWLNIGQFEGTTMRDIPSHWEEGLKLQWCIIFSQILRVI